MSRSFILLRAALVTLALLGGVTSAAVSKVFFSQKEALALAFPDATRIEKQTHILTEEQVAAIERRSRSEIESRLVTLHTGWRGDELLGHAHIDVHTVRTKPEAFMVVLAPGGEVASVRILAFHEPLDYLPTERWYEQFVGKRGGDGVRVGRDIDAVSGATLSARAASAGVRRALAFYETLLKSVSSAGPGAAPAN